MVHREWVTWPSGRSVKWFPTAYSSPTLWAERPHPFWGVFMGDIAGVHWRTINRVRCDYCIPSNRLHNSVLVRALIWSFSYRVSQTIYFASMMVFTFTSQMYHRILVPVPVLLRVPEYFSTSRSIRTSTITLELMSTVRVPKIQFASISTGYVYPSPAGYC